MINNPLGSKYVSSLPLQSGSSVSPACYMELANTTNTTVVHAAPVTTPVAAPVAVPAYASYAPQVLAPQVNYIYLPYATNYGYSNYETPDEKLVPTMPKTLGLAEE